MHSLGELSLLPEAWQGGYYELAIEYKPAHTQRLKSALISVWRSRCLAGPWSSRQCVATEPSELALEDVNSLNIDDVHALYGVSALPNGHRCLCATTLVREPSGSDWLYFGFPLGSLGQVFPVGAFPFDDGTPLDWRLSVDLILRGLAAQVFQGARFQLALVGWTDGEELSAASITRTGVPQRRWCGLLLPDGPELVDGKKHLFLADSALRWSRLWGYGSTPSLATTEDGTSFLAWPFADEMGKDRHGTGKLGSKSFDGALGWEVLSESKWTWDLCTAEFQITEGPSVPKDPGLTPLQLHRYNGHGRRTPYSHPSIQ